MASAKLLVRVANGGRKPFAGEVLVNLFDGAQRRVHSAFHPRPNVEFTIPVTNGPIDSYRVVVAAKEHRDAGQRAIPIAEGATSIIDVMLLPKRARPVFESLARLDRIHPNLRRLVEEVLTQQFGAADDGAYLKLQTTNPEGLMTLLNVAAAFDGFVRPQHPFDFIEALLELRPDRFFARARETMRGFCEGQPAIFKSAASILHPGAFASFKDSRYPEGNVQFTFAPIEGTTTSLKLDGDIDLFADTASHLLLEVLPNDMLNPKSHTDPRRAYALRWMAAERRKDALKAVFDPPFILERV